MSEYVFCIVTYFLYLSMIFRHINPGLAKSLTEKQSYE